jgi:6-phosphogluconolactonase
MEKHVMSTLPEAIVHGFATPEASAEALAKDCIAHIAETLTQRSIFHLGLSGGSTPVPFFKALAEALPEQSFPLEELCLWWCDERAVHRGHKESNYRLVQEHLLNPLKSHVILKAERLRGDADVLASEARRYSDLLSEIGALDYVVLGMGNDGHTASLFPGESEPDSPCFVSQHPEGFDRLTLSSHYLSQSAQRRLLLSGEQKWHTWQAAQQSQDTLQYPVLRIQAAGELQVFCDPLPTPQGAQ